MRDPSSALYSACVRRGGGGGGGVGGGWVGDGSTVFIHMPHAGLISQENYLQVIPNSVLKNNGDPFFFFFFLYFFFTNRTGSH